MSENPETEVPKRDLSKVAKEQFGTKFVGEVTEDQTTEAIDEKPGGEEPETVEAAEDTEQKEGDPKEEEKEHDPDTTEVDWENDGGGDNDEGAETVTTVEEPTFTVKVDGVESEVLQSEIIKSYQINRASEKNLSEAKAKSEEILVNATADRKALDESMAVAANLLNSEFEILEAEKIKIDWDSLEEDDPATFAAKRLKFQDRKDKIVGRIETARIKFRDAQEKQVADNQKNLNDVIRAEQIQLIEKIPEWKDQKVADKESKEVVDYLLKEGIPEAQIKQLYSSAELVIARKAMFWDKSQSSANPAKKKIAAVPKTMKPGAAKQIGAGAIKKLKDAQARAKTSGSVDDAMKVMALRRQTA